MSTVSNQQLFNHRVGILATMHGKEKVIAPLLEKELSLKIIVPEKFNTDIFGTFTREIQRPGTQIEAARRKAEKVLEMTGETLAVASEGSFGPHPNFPYISSNREIVLFLDKLQNLEIIGEEFSIDTNHNHRLVKSFEEADAFAKQVGFPEHGLVVMSNEIIKGILTEEGLVEAVNLALANSPNGQVHIETDMRAMYNPTRMKNIEKATWDLIKKINSQCPNCFTPGFAITQTIAGLPCAICYLPTAITRAVIYECQKCGFRQEQLSANSNEFADPGQCVYCNP